MVAVFFLFGGVCIGVLVGWKAHEKRIPLKFLWESEGLIGRDPPSISFPFYFFYFILFLLLDDREKG